jgi:hypothetical protein
LRGKTGRNPLDPINREKRIHENPSHVNLTPDFIGSISKNRVFQRELSRRWQGGFPVIYGGEEINHRRNLGKGGEPEEDHTLHTFRKNGQDSLPVPPLTGIVVP